MLFCDVCSVSNLLEPLLCDSCLYSVCYENHGMECGVAKSTFPPSNSSAMDLTVYSSDLPAYSPTAPSPSYSLDPTCGEQRLQLTPRSRSLHRTPTSTFVRKSGKTTIVLYDQEQDTRTPSYGRSANISGSLCLDESENVTGVTIKVCA